MRSGTSGSSAAWSTPTSSSSSSRTRASLRARRVWKKELRASPTIASPSAASNGLSQPGSTWTMSCTVFRSTEPPLPSLFGSWPLPPPLGSPAESAAPVVPEPPEPAPAPAAAPLPPEPPPPVCFDFDWWEEPPPALPELEGELPLEEEPLLPLPDAACAALLPLPLLPPPLLPPPPPEPLPVGGFC